MRQVNKVYVRVHGWRTLDEGIKVTYTTWDGKCLCTSQRRTEVIDFFEVNGSPPEKQDIHKKIVELFYS